MERVVEVLLFALALVFALSAAARTTQRNRRADASPTLARNEDTDTRPARRVDSNPRRADAQPRLSPSAALSRLGAAVKTTARGSAAPRRARSTCVSHTLTLPLDVLKTRIQSDAALAGLSLAAVSAIVAAEEPARAAGGLHGERLRLLHAGRHQIWAVRHVQGRHLPRSSGGYKHTGRTTTAALVWVASSACAEVVARLALCPMEAVYPAGRILYARLDGHATVLLTENGVTSFPCAWRPSW